MLFRLKRLSGYLVPMNLAALCCLDKAVIILLDHASRGKKLRIRLCLDRVLLFLLYLFGFSYIYVLLNPMPRALLLNNGEGYEWNAQRPNKLPIKILTFSSHTTTIVKYAFIREIHL